VPSRGEVIADRYELIEVIAEGRTSIIYAARDRKKGGEVALKRLVDRATRVHAERLERTARAAGALAHPSICAVLASGVSANRAFLALERLHGPSLAQRLATSGPLPLSAALDTVTRLLEVLQLAHDAGFVHGDLRPTKVVVGDGGPTPKLLDLGGDPRYVEPRDDVFACGGLFHELLTGQACGAGSPGLPTSIARIVTRAVTNGVAGFRSAREMRAALLEVAQETPTLRERLG
jgi:serine/threonine protein kinase